MTTTNEPIACDLHDHLEVACLYGYQLRIVKRDGEVVMAKAKTTRTARGAEFLVVETKSDLIEVEMHTIASVEAIGTGLAFTKLVF